MLGHSRMQVEENKDVIHGHNQGRHDMVLVMILTPFDSILDAVLIVSIKTEYI